MGEEKQRTQHGMQRVSGVNGLMVSLGKGEAGSSALQCMMRALELRVQVLGSEMLRAGRGEYGLGS